MTDQASDLLDCASEPIRIPGSIQPHGAMLVVDPATLRVLQTSANTEAVLGVNIEAGVGITLQAISGLGGHDTWTEVRAWLDAGGDTPFLRSIRIRGRALQVVGHLTLQGVVLEFEEAPAHERETLEALNPRLGRFLDRIEAVRDVRRLAQIAARELREITGFNRVLVYSFDQDWNGTVIAEDGDGVLPSYLDLRFPASDIPAQARELYRVNRLRLIPDADYRPVPLIPPVSPLDGQPTDLGGAGLRSVSPIHLQYMRNMETYASMSISIMVDGRLWGLVSCHNREPKTLNAQVRSVCDFLGQILSLQIGARERSAHAAERIRLKQIESELLARLAHAPSVQSGLADSAATWMGITGASGAAVVVHGEIRTAGRTPSPDQIRALAEWLSSQSAADVFATESLCKHWPPAKEFAEIGSGLLAATISQTRAGYLLWFRPEVVHTVTWAGDPRKPMDPGVDRRLHPRASFEHWKEQVRGCSAPWSAAEVESAADLRNAIVNIVLRQAEQRAELTSQLEVTNKELESFSYSVSHDLRAPFRHIVGYAELLSERADGGLDEKSRHYLRSIVEAALAAGRLVDDLLNFSQLGRASLVVNRIDMAKLVEETLRTIERDVAGRRIDWQVGALPVAWGDGALIRQALLNLVENAVKYSRDRDPAVIEIFGEESARETVYTVRDNGVGFEMSYVGKLFGVFQRLHRSEEFEGTGIGLALVKRVIDRHGGWIRAEGEVGRGATFTFGLPKHDAKESRVV